MGGFAIFLCVELGRAVISGGGAVAVQRCPSGTKASLRAQLDKDQSF